jgi:tetraacyldisaccharide 4'-kinase
VILTRADQAAREERDAALRRIRRAAPRAVIATAIHEPKTLEPVGGGKAASPSWLEGKRVYAVSGIGNPAAFESTLVRLGAELAGTARYADHQSYGEDRLAEIGRAAARSGADAVVTTQKDAVKWSALPEDAPPARALHVGISFTSGEEAIRDLVRAALRPPSAPG